MTTETATVPQSSPDEFHGVGGAYVIGEDGVRRPAPPPEPQPEQPAAPAEEEPQP
jgi:hypothetical protein